MATKKRFPERLVFGSIVGLIALIAIFTIAQILTDNQSVILFALSILALLFYLMIRRLR
jgi:hypothetical protein